MRLAVSYDDEGNILTLFDPDTLQREQGSLTYLPAEKERHDILDVPQEHAELTIRELVDALRVETGRGAPRFRAKM